MARICPPWRLLPAKELGCGSPATVWRRLDEWARAGVFDALHLQVLDRLGEQDRLDWTRANADTTSVRAKRGGPCGRKSGRSWQAMVQPAFGLRRPRPASCGRADGRQCQRQCGLRGAAGRCSGGGRRVGGAAGPTPSTPRRGTTPGIAAPTCAGAESRPGSLGEEPRPRSGWDGIAGGWSGRCRGGAVFGGCRCAGIATPGGCLRLCCWGVRWCAATDARHQPPWRCQPHHREAPMPQPLPVVLARGRLTWPRRSGQQPAALSRLGSDAGRRHRPRRHHGHPRP